MSLAPGTRVGVYEIVELIGVGGMGEVYRARDARLGRDVAIKTLPDLFASDAERLARFEREARTLAQLNHPHIASIYGIEGGSNPALAMEMVEGETLADRIARGPLPLDEALPIARQIAEAVEHAHDKGVVHRDLKPANVKLVPTANGVSVKVLDFGLAKAMTGDITGMSVSSVVSSPTITSANMTRAGIILGTAAYMAPEQARGKMVDQRADIWAFACVLFEMLTARRAFQGEDMADVLARVIQSEPDWTLLPSSAPRALTTLLQRCLRKDSARRIHSIADVRLDLDEVFTAGSPRDAVAVVPSPPTRRWPAAVVGLALGMALCAVIGAAYVMTRPVPPPPQTLRFSIAMPDGWTLFRSSGSGRVNVAISPDGRTLAAVLLSEKDGSRRIFVRPLSESAFRELPGTEGANSVFWAPDSQRLGFHVPGGVRRAELAGSGSQSMVSTQGSSMIASWGPGDSIIASQTTGRPLLQWPAAGGTVSTLRELEAGVRSRSVPFWLPGDLGYLYVDQTAPGKFTVRHARVDGASDVTTFESAGTHGVSSQSGHLLLGATESSGRTVLTAQPFDPATDQLSGRASVLVTDLNPAFSASDTGVLVYGQGLIMNEQFRWLDDRGALQSLASEALRISNFDLSPNGRLLVVQSGRSGLMLHDLDRKVTSRLSDRGNDPVWSNDGSQIAFAVQDPADLGIHVMPAFGGASKRVYVAKEPTYLDDWSADGKWLAGHVNILGPGILIPQAEGATPILFEQGQGGVDETRFSPDGKWLAYEIRNPGAEDVYLAAVPPTGERWKVSVDGGAQPRWRADGKALYYLSLSGALMMVDIDTKPGAPPAISVPRELFQTGMQVQPGVDQYAVSRDGKRFLIRRADEATGDEANQVHVIVNWPELVKK